MHGERRLPLGKALCGAAIALGMGLLPGPAEASCGSAFCSLSTDWNLQGVWTDPGFRVDVRYESITQDQPTVGNRTVAVGALPRDHNEVSTQNQNLLTTVDYAFNESWGLSVGVPYVERDHKHIETATGTPERWQFQELGDVRVVARYQPMLHDMTSATGIALNFGLKLPTGRIDVTNRSGERAERTLQPGSGTTDALAGASWRLGLGLRSLLFIQGLWQNALDMRESYQPGARVTLDTGFRSNLTNDLAVIVQVNTLLKGIDGGAQAEPEDSGGTFIYLSPGVSYALGNAVQVYGFYQVPLYQYVNGLQLTAKDSVAFGTSLRF